MISKSYIDAFVPDGKTDEACLNCGVCLQKCPVMKMGKEESKAEFQRLLNGEETQRVLNECTFCYSCNSYCPQGLRPYNLIMERMIAKNTKNGATVPPVSQLHDDRQKRIRLLFLTFTKRRRKKTVPFWTSGRRFLPNPKTFFLSAVSGGRFPSVWKTPRRWPVCPNLDRGTPAAGRFPIVLAIINTFPN